MRGAARTVNTPFISAMALFKSSGFHWQCKPFFGKLGICYMTKTEMQLAYVTHLSRLCLSLY